MIVGIGTDLVHIPRLSGTLARWGDRFLRKVLHSSEIIAYRQRSDASAALRFLAGRWAAKEAVFKAFGGIRGLLLFTQIEIVPNKQGRDN